MLYQGMPNRAEERSVVENPQTAGRTVVAGTRMKNLIGATTVTSNNQSKSVSLNTMVGAAIVVWVAAFASVYGPLVFGYVGMHAVTTGLFLLAIARSDRRHARAAGLQPAMTGAASPVKQQQKSAKERRTSAQPAA
jgi:hypothetical protein